MNFWKKHRNLLLGLTAFILLIVYGLNRSIPTNWTPTFNKADKIPYGTYVLRDLIADLFVHEIEENKDKLSLFLPELTHKDSYVAICPYPELDSLDVQAIDAFVSKGGQMFISAPSYSGEFLSAFDVAIDYDFEPSTQDSNIISLSGYETDYVYDNRYQLIQNSFIANDENILGYRDENVNFIRVNKGQGTLFLHLDPSCFTNYHILKSNDSYASQALSYIDKDSRIYWDNHLSLSIEDMQVSPTLDIVLDRSPLKYSLVVIFVTLFFYMLFKSKRMQKPIPIIEPPRNDSAEFAETLGLLYFNNGDNMDIVLKRFTYFKKELKTRFHIPLEVINTFATQNITLRTGAKKEDLEELNELVTYIQLNGASHSSVMKFLAIEYRIQEQLK